MPCNLSYVTILNFAPQFPFVSACEDCMEVGLETTITPMSTESSIHYSPLSMFSVTVSIFLIDGIHTFHYTQQGKVM